MDNNDYISNLLGALATSINTSINEQIAKLGGRSITHDSALVVIYNHPNDKIDEISKALGLTHSGGVRLINTLEKEKMVIRKKSCSDARSVEIELTVRGKQRVKKILEARSTVTNAILENLNEDQIAILIPIFESALKSFTKDKDSARRICRLCDESECRPHGCPVEMSIS